MEVEEAGNMDQNSKTYLVKVKTCKDDAKVVVTNDGSLEVWVKSPPKDGKANIEVMNLVSEHFKVKNYKVNIISGLGSPFKLIKVVTP